MSNIAGSFSLIAVVDGTTLNGFMYHVGAPLVQRYTPGTDTYVPNFKNLSEDERPTSMPLIREISAGAVLVPTSCTFYYNNVAITFDASTNLSTNSGFAGLFKRLTYPLTLNGSTYQLPAVRVMSNFVSASNHDNDLLSCDGTVTVAGAEFNFKSIFKTIVIQETTGSNYDAIIVNNTGSQLTEPGGSLTEKVEIYKDGSKVTDLSGFAFQWYKLTGTGEELWSGRTAQTCVVTTDDVDNALKLRCQVTANSTEVFSGYDEVTDFSDPHYPIEAISGITGKSVKPGETAVISIEVHRRSDGSLVSGYDNWSWYTLNNAGAAFVLTGQTSSTFTAASISVSYTDIVRAGGAINFSYKNA